MTTDVAIPSRTRGDVEYRVTLGADGSAVCTCMGYEMRGACWHLAAAQKEHAVTSQALEVIKITPPTSILPSRDELSVIADIARSVIGARGQAVPAAVDTPAKALAIMLAGHELGVRPMTALRHVLVIGGRTEPDAQLMAAIVIAREGDAKFEVIELTDKTCTMRLTRPSRNVRVEYTYDLADAERAGLVKPGSNWQKFPKDMLRWAATKRLCRLGAPDLINAVGAVQVGPVSSLLDEAAPVPANLIDLDQLPAGALYNEGDEPDPVIDPETGEVLEGEARDEAAEPGDDEPSEVIGMVVEGGPLSRDVWQYVGELLTDIAARHFEGDWERVYAAFAGHPAAAPFFRRTTSGRPFIDPRGRTNEEAQLLAELLNAWLRVQQAPSVQAARSRAAEKAAEPAAVKVPRPPKAREGKDERLGAFSNIGEFYGYCHRELNLTGPQVREIAGVGESAAPDSILGFEGGLDMLKVKCATAAAGVEVS